MIWKNLKVRFITLIIEIFLKLVIILKKVMFYINNICHGGAERVIVNIANYLSEEYETVFVTSTKEPDEYILADNVKRYVLEETFVKRNRLQKNIYRIKNLRRICKNEKPDILISFMAEPNFRSIIASLGLKTKCLVSVRNDPAVEYGGRSGKLVAKYLLPLVDGCVFQTVDAKNYFGKRMAEKSRVIYNAVKEEFFETEHRYISKKVVTFGRLQAQKNQLLLINSFSKVLEKHPDAKLEIYGIGNLEELLQNRIKELGLEDSISLMGITDNVAEILSESAVFVLSSDYEGMPNALMEALAVGVPSVSTDCPCGGPKTLIENGVNGILIPLHSGEDVLAEAICSLLENPEKAEEMGKKAKERAVEFKYDRILNEWKKYINSVAN